VLELTRKVLVDKEDSHNEAGRLAQATKLAGKCADASARMSTSLRADLLASAQRSKLAGRTFDATAANPAACKVPTSNFCVNPLMDTQIPPLVAT
jgi:hypothetical protein